MISIPRDFLSVAAVLLNAPCYDNRFHEVDICYGVCDRPTSSVFEIKITPAEGFEYFLARGHGVMCSNLLSRLPVFRKANARVSS